MDDATTLWLRRFTAGDESAVEALWERYRGGLLHRRRSSDEEDVVLSAFKSFCLGTAAGRYPDLEDCHSVWKLLLTITLRKANAELKRQFAQKRGGGRLVGEAVFGPVNDTRSAHGLAEIPDGQLRPDLAAMMDAQCEQLLGRLKDENASANRPGKARRIHQSGVGRATELLGRHDRTQVTENPPRVAGSVGR